MYFAIFRYKDPDNGCIRFRSFQLKSKQFKEAKEEAHKLSETLCAGIPAEYAPVLRSLKKITIKDVYVK